MLRPRLILSFLFGCAFLGGGMALWNMAIKPWMQERLVTQTSSGGSYRHNVVVALDGFAGYAPLRSGALEQRLRSHGIRLDMQDDGGDYLARFQALERGEVQLATFTIDALLRVSAGGERNPAAIVSVIDESRGADAIVGYVEAVPNLRSLTDGQVDIVCTPNSPSEYLCRVLASHFGVGGDVSSRIIARDGSADVLATLKQTPSSVPRVFVLWEPQVSQALEDGRVHRLVDTSVLRGHIVDVLVAERRFLRDKPEVVDTVLREYFATLYELRANRQQLIELIAADAAAGGETVSPVQAEALVDGIHFAGLSDNYGYFGMQTVSGIVPIEDAVRDIADVLLSTNGIAANHLGGKEHQLLYGTLLEGMHREQFHPGNLASAGLSLQPDPVASSQPLVALDASGWSSLRDVASIRTEPVRFRRGRAELTDDGQDVLAGIVRTLRSWPSYYCTIEGQALDRGNAAANRRLAESRAQAVLEGLASLGIERERLRATSVISDDTSSSVRFRFGQLPY